MTSRKADIAARLSSTRQRTLDLLATVPPDLFRRRVHAFYSPIGWHFGHVGRTEDYWVMQTALGKPAMDEKLDFLYTDRPDNPKDGRTEVLPREAVVDYLTCTRERVLAALEEASLEEGSQILRDGYAWEFAIQHEMQHQETIVELLTLIARELGGHERPTPLPTGDPQPQEWIDVPAGEAKIGSDEPFVYDNERLAHCVSLSAFQIASRPATVADWAAFIGDGGYDRPELWSAEGWAWRLASQIGHPEYWIAAEGGWLSFTVDGVRTLHPSEPVFGISHFEAEAYAAWSGARLPTEFEWEAAARLFPASSDDPARLHPEPIVSNADRPIALGCGVWEHTASPFLPYPGFTAYPYDGYSLDHMDGRHFVLRGGSFATSPALRRPSFRNWYIPTYRQGFLGVRLAR